MEKEKRVYLINYNKSNFDFREFEQLSDYEPIMQEAEAQGNVYSLQGFQDACNNEDIDISNSFILIA
jgi:hypothetical protein